MSTLTSKEIENCHDQVPGNPNVTSAIDEIEENNGDIANSAEYLATRGGIEGVEDNAELRWFDEKLQQCRDFLAQPKYESLRTSPFPELIPPLTEFFAELLDCSPEVAERIATPFAIYIHKEGMDK